MNISEMKRLSIEAGFHWFKKDTMRFFGTVIEAPPNKENIFITSEWADFDNSKRAYTLRWFNTKDANVETLGEYLAYKTLKEARKARKEYTKSKKEMGINY